MNSQHAQPNESELISLITHLASQNHYWYKKHALIQRTTRNLTDADVKDILLNVSSILRTDNDNPDGVTSYKIEGGSHNHRLAIKFTDEHDTIIIITVMDNETKK